MALRVIGGTHKGRRLSTLGGRQTRPTSDRLRESIFNILAFRLHSKHVLDLFAGSGALGIEALSRGAVAGVFVENHPDALAIIDKNIRSCGLADRATLIRWDIRRNLNCLKSIQFKFNLVFMDPPYNQDLVAPTLTHLAGSGGLDEAAMILVEHDPKEALPDPMIAFDLWDQRRYGSTVISFLIYNGTRGKDYSR